MGIPLERRADPGHRPAPRRLPHPPERLLPARPRARARRAGRAPPRRLGGPGRRHPRHRRRLEARRPGRRRGRPGRGARRAAGRPAPRHRSSRPWPSAGRSGSATATRTALVDPYRLDFQRGRWYLTGFDHARDEERNFRLDRIDGERDGGAGQGASSARRPTCPASSSSPGSSARASRSMARVLVDVDQAALARHQLGRRGRGARRRLGRGRAPGDEPGRRSARSSSASSTTPRCSSRRSCATELVAWLQATSAGHMSRIGANDRLQRLLSLVPWVVAHRGAAVDEVCARFAITEAELLADLDTLRYVGVYPFTPDALIDVVIEDGRVWIHHAEPFDRPLRLTPEEALALVAAGTSLLAVPGADPEGPLARGLAKLAATLGVDADDRLEVQLGRRRRRVDPRRSCGPRRPTTARSRSTTTRTPATSTPSRTIDPYRVYADQGQWYVVGHCHLAGGERIFRVDRIQAAEPARRAVRATRRAAGRRRVPSRPRRPTVVLDLTPEAAWVAEHYPVEAVEELGDGRIRVTLAVTARPWLERLLLRLGPDADHRVGRRAAGGSRGAFRGRPTGPGPVRQRAGGAVACPCCVSLRTPRGRGRAPGRRRGDRRDRREDETPSRPEASRLRSILEWVAVIGGALVIALVIKTFLLQAFYIPSSSMEPTLEHRRPGARQQAQLPDARREPRRPHRVRAARGRAGQRDQRPHQAGHRAARRDRRGPERPGPDRRPAARGALPATRASPPATSSPSRSPRTTSS